MFVCVFETETETETERGRERDRDRLKQLVPTVGKFHTHLPLQAAWLAYDTKYAVSMRRHLPPSFPEIRHTPNLAQVMALSQSLEMITFRIRNAVEMQQ